MSTSQCLGVDIDQTNRFNFLVNWGEGCGRCTTAVRYGDLKRIRASTPINDITRAVRVVSGCTRVHRTSENVRSRTACYIVHTSSERFGGCRLQLIDLNALMLLIKHYFRSTQQIPNHTNGIKPRENFFLSVSLYISTLWSGSTKS